MAQAFIELAEAVNVDVEHRIFCFLGAALVQGIVEPAAKQGPIGQPGEAVIILQVLEALIGLLEFGQVGKQAGIMSDLAGAVADGVDMKVTGRSEERRGGKEWRSRVSGD